MIKKNLIKISIILFFVYGCGYSPIYTNKNSNFAITQLNTTGNNTLYTGYKKPFVIIVFTTNIVTKKFFLRHGIR